MASSYLFFRMVEGRGRGRVLCKHPLDGFIGLPSAQTTIMGITPFMNSIDAEFLRLMVFMSIHGSRGSSSVDQFTPVSMTV